MNTQKADVAAAVAKQRATYAHIVKAENLVFEETHRRYGNGFKTFVDGIDALLVLSYLESYVPTDQTSSEYQFYVHVRHLYYEIPSSFRSCISLAERGLYSDAFNCLRSVLEALVKHKFLQKNKDMIMAYETDGEDVYGKKVTIRRAFKESCGSDVQEVVYRLGSQFEHKNFAAGLPLLRASLNQEKEYSLTPSFQQQLCEGIINSLIYLIFGFLNLSEHFIAFKWSDANLRERHQGIKGFLAKLIQDRRIQFSHAVEWNSAMERVVCMDVVEIEAAASISSIRSGISQST